MEYLGRFVDNIVNPVIYFLFAVALLYFLYGVLVFIINADDESKRAIGKQHMFWGIIGLFIMVSVYGIIGIILGTIGAPPPDNLSGDIQF
jgi:uncharacterized membrane protein YbhN (UPF0104 family)